MIQVQNISKSFGEQVLLDGASMLVADHERVGLVGRNGCGKSTLFKMILGQECIDGGSIDIPKGYTIGYLQQHINFTHATVHEEACSVLKVNEDGWLEEHKVEAILFGLGFDEESMQKSPMLLSGGFQIRLNLAKVLASEPDMLLLDEPTNYLDIVSMRWLSRFLRTWKGEVLLITHDHHFMDEVCTHTVGIHRHKMRKVKGSVEKLRETIAEEEEVAMRTQENEQRKKEQLEKVIERFRYKAAKAAMVQSKIKAAAKLANGERLSHERNLDFSFKEAEFPGKRMLQIKSLHFGYNDGPELITDLTFEVFKGDRIGIIGPNGRGKTTLLNLIAKEFEPTSGEICHNPNLLINYFGQTNINRLNLDNTVEEEIATAIAEVSQKSRARGLAGLMMFSGDNALKKIKVLSEAEATVQVSLYSMNPETHDAITKRPGSFEKTKRAIEMLREAQIPCRISCPTMKPNYKDYLDVLAYARSLKMDAQTDFIIMGKMNCDTSNLACRLDLTETRRILEDIVYRSLPVNNEYFDPSKKEYLESDDDFSRRKVCGACVSSVCLDATGYYYPCPAFAGVNLGSCYEHDLKWIWNESPETLRIRGVTGACFPKCAHCSDRAYCSVCMCRNFNETGDMFTPAKHFCDVAKLNHEVVEEKFKRMKSGNVAN